MKAFFNFLDELELLPRNIVITFWVLVTTIMLCFCVIAYLSCHIQYQNELIEWAEYRIKKEFINSFRFDSNSSLKVLDVNDFDNIVKPEKEGSR